MRIPRLTHCLLALVCTLAGCTQTGGLRSSAVANSNANPNIRTVASIGDKPIPIVTGEPGLSQRPETEELDLPPAAGARISGRVYDDRGRPVPNAKVRLAVGGSATGKAGYATTDRSGAFTLRGLRGGSSYAVIAEYQGQNGTMSGRIETDAPDTNVRISLQSRDSEPDRAHSTIRPAKSRVNATVEDDDEDSADDRTKAGRYNSEDLEPPAAEATSLLPRANRSASRISANDSNTRSRSGWNALQRTADDEDGSRSRSGRAVDEPGAGRSSNSSVDAPGQDEDEGPNPLPPALEPRKVGAAFPGDSGDDPPLKIATGTQRNSSLSSRERESAAADSDQAPSTERHRRSSSRDPRPMPEDVVPKGREMRPDSFAPIRGTDPAEAANNQSSRPPRAGRRACGPAAETRLPRSSDSSDESSAGESRPVDGAGSRIAPGANSPIARAAVAPVVVEAFGPVAASTPRRG